MQDSEIEKKLFFIVGCGRSGTTLLKSILCSHSDIYLPSETFFYTSISKRYGRLLRGTFGDEIDYVVSRWWIRDAGVTKCSLVESMDDFDINLPVWNRVFLALLKSLSGDKDATVIGEKTPAHIECADKLLADFPHCKIIQLIRDPRAVLASYRASGVGTSQPAAVIKEWREAYEMKKNIENNERYFCLRYEDLISNPQHQVEKVCAFLNVEYESGMMEFHRRSHSGFAAEQRHHENTLSPIFSSSLNSWKDKLSKNQIALVEQQLGAEMEQAGYPLVGHEMMFARAYFMLSVFIEAVSRRTVRRFRQAIKSFRANRRLSAS